MVDLDNTKKLIQDQGGDEVVKSIDNLGAQLRASYTEARKIIFPQNYLDASSIVLSGMGGSRFPALIVYYLFKDKFKKPFTINDDYTLPGFIDSKTVVILSSYSGTTEEVLMTGHDAMDKKALMTGITSGGDLEQMLKSAKAPHYVFDPIYNTSGQPRIGFGYAVGGLIALLTNLGVIDVPDGDVMDAIESLDSLIAQCKVDVALKDNPAKKMATELYGQYPYYIVSEFLTGVGNAVGNQTNETAKSISSYRVIPELNHHLMEGLKFPETHRAIGTFVFFYSSLFSPRIQKRFHITRDVVEQNNLKTIWHELKGATSIAQVFELMAFGGYLSMYLSALYEQNPTAIPFVDYFKNKMKE